MQIQGKAVRHIISRFDAVDVRFLHIWTGSDGYRNPTPVRFLLRKRSKEFETFIRLVFFFRESGIKQTKSAGDIFRDIYFFVAVETIGRHIYAMQKAISPQNFFHIKNPFQPRRAAACCCRERERLQFAKNIILQATYFLSHKITSPKSGGR